MLSDDELRRVWAASATRGVFGDLARLYLLTGLRREEAAGLRWADLEGGIALIGNTKSGQPHRLPLSGAALAILERQPRRGERVFVAPNGTPVASAATNWHRERDRLAAASGVTDWTWHDLRRTCRTLLARIGTDDLVAELIVNHALPGKLRRTYVLHKYEAEMREALERLASFVDQIVSGEANVVRLRPSGLIRARAAPGPRVAGGRQPPAGRPATWGDPRCRPMLHLAPGPRRHQCSIASSHRDRTDDSPAGEFKESKPEPADRQGRHHSPEKDPARVRKGSRTVTPARRPATTC